MRLTDAGALARGRSGSLLEDLAGTDAPEPTSGGDASPGEGLPGLLARTPFEARRSVLLRRLRDRVGSVLGMPPGAALDPDRPLGELGLDSLLAVELKNVLGSEVERRLPATLTFDYPTLAALTDHLLDLLSPTVDPVGADPVSRSGAARQTEAADADPLGAVESLSDDEVDRLLSEQFERNE